MLWVFVIDQVPKEEIIYIPVDDTSEMKGEILKEDNEGEILKQVQNDSEVQDEQIIVEEQEEPEELEETVAVTIPGSLKLDVLFSTQAPTKDWGMPYQEACEEASLIMTSYYFEDKYLDRSIMNTEILDLVDWEMERFGYYTDTTLAEVQIIANEYFHLDTEIISNVSEENIKYQLVQGNLLIIPFAGRLLINPYFSGEGPLFHMAVVKGYDHKDFIMNDPGLLTLGEDFKYSYKNLLESVHDWNGGDVMNGARKMLIIKGLQ
ncbi:MAG: C39 family peptidase [Clostridiales bacterium]|nr:C39 family peptidase [Clostridiales bacterium]